MNDKKKISVVIPTLNAAERLKTLVDALLNQTLPPEEILIIDSSSDDGTIESVQNIKTVRTKAINRQSFNHGLTRHGGFQDTYGDFVCFLTDDAIPANDKMISNLMAPFTDPEVAMVSGKQIPKQNARKFERLIREFNYPSKSNVRSKNDIEKMGVKAFFASDACCAYRRSAYLEVGGFEEVNTNEDMLIAARFLYGGFKVAYAADALVEHSHNLTLKQQYERYKAIGYFMKSHDDDLGNISAAGEGAALVKMVASQLFKTHSYIELLAFFGDCAARFLGNTMGKWHAKNDAS